MEFYKGYESSTHQPLVKAVLEAYSPEFVLELGIGNYSTPLFAWLNYCGVDNDEDWIQLMRARSLNIWLIHHKVDFNKGDRPESLSQVQRDSLKSYYNELTILPQRPNLLFVDCYTASRTIAINTLKDRFDLIIFHDCQPEGLMVYGYDKIETKGFGMKFLKSPTAWTALMYRQNKELNIEKYINEYLKEWPEAAPMILTDRYL